MNKASSSKRTNALLIAIAALSIACLTLGHVGRVSAEETLASNAADAASTGDDHQRANTWNTILVFDEKSVESAKGVTFHLNPAKKHPENPVLSPGEPQQWDSLQVIWPGTVLLDPKDNLFRCWYSGMDAVQANRPPLWVPGYAESKDGIHWTKPNLGQHKHNGQDTNRIVVDWSNQVLSLVMDNPDQSDPQRRFLAFWYGSEPDRLLKVLASSADGKVWKNEGTALRPVDAKRESYYDICQVIFQPDAPNEEDRVLAYAQVYMPRVGVKDGGPIRQIGLLHGTSLKTLRPISANPAEFIVLGPEDGIDDQIHFASVRKVGSKYVLLFESDRFGQTPVHGDLRLAVSDDGRHFRRVDAKTPFVATGSKGMWDENLLVTSTASMQDVGNEVWIYYFGCSNVFTRWPNGQTAELRGSFYYPTQMGVATLPRDRFAYASGPGHVVTTAVEPGERGLWLNADGEQIAIDAIDGSGTRIASGRLDDSTIRGNYRRVQWLSTPPAGEFRVRAQLSAGERLYSVQY
jgi:hypothetical protein